MIPFALLLIACGLVVASLLLLYLCAFCVPLACGLIAGYWAFSTGAGLFGACGVGALAFAATVVLLQLASAFLRPGWLRWLIVGLTCLSSGLIGYLIIHNVLCGSVPSDMWRTLFALIASIAATAGAYRQLYASGPTA